MKTFDNDENRTESGATHLDNDDLADATNKIINAQIPLIKMMLYDLVIHAAKKQELPIDNLFAGSEERKRICVSLVADPNIKGESDVVNFKFRIS